MSLTVAVVLAAGKGTRLVNYRHLPKALVPVGDETLVDHNLRRLAELDLERIVVVVGHMAEKVKAHLAESPWRDRSVEELSPRLLASMTYTHNAIYNEFSQVNFLAWSLEIEFQFYVLAPMLVLVFRLRQLLLRREQRSAAATIEHLVGMQAQVPGNPSPHKSDIF